MSKVPIDPVIRFWAKVDRSGGPDACWTWTASQRIAFGYGMFCISRFKSVSAHRFSWELHNGPIPKGLSILHRCDNPKCVNPAHLTIGSQKENIQDASQKGRLVRPSGARNGQSKLTDKDVQTIRRLRAQKVPIATVAAQFGVSLATISMIVHGKRWAHLQEIV